MWQFWMFTRLRKLENHKMTVKRLIALFLAFGLLQAMQFVSRGASADEDLLVCYYDSSGKQRDADSCKLGWHLSHRDAVQLRPRCRSNTDAVCHIGHSGPCRPGSGKYSKYWVFDRSTGRCPSRYKHASGGGSQAVAPTCPSGFVLIDGECKRGTAAEYTEFTILDGYDLYGGDYKSLPGEVHYDDCEFECKNDRRCKAFTYNTKRFKCFLKSIVPRRKRFRNARSGIKK